MCTICQGALLSFAGGPQNVLQVSKDGGKTFPAVSISGTYFSGDVNSAASSADGKKLYGFGGGGNDIWTIPGPVGPYNVIASSDTGNTWSKSYVKLMRPGSDDKYPQAIQLHMSSASSDGKTIIGAGGTFIDISTDSGTTWTMHNILVGGHETYGVNGINGLINGVAISDDGTKMFAVGARHVFISTDSGATWRTVQPTNPSIAGMQFDGASIAASSDGSNLVVVSGGSNTGNIWISQDGGNTWTSKEYYDTFSCVASSSNGSRLIAFGKYIWTSDDFGMTWNSYAQIQRGNNVTVQARNSTSVYPTGYSVGNVLKCIKAVSSSDGSKWAAAYGGYIYIGTK
jgi:hypothetical protein